MLPFNKSKAKFKITPHKKKKLKKKFSLSQTYYDGKEIKESIDNEKQKHTITQQK